MLEIVFPPEKFEVLYIKNAKRLNTVIIKLQFNNCVICLRFLLPFMIAS